MPVANPTPADLGDVYVWDDGAEAPRMRRQDEATVDGVDPKEYNLFVVCPAIGVRTERASTGDVLRARREGRVLRDDGVVDLVERVDHFRAWYTLAG